MSSLGCKIVQWKVLKLISIKVTLLMSSLACTNIQNEMNEVGGVKT
jgi:hypothetical protein